MQIPTSRDPLCVNNLIYHEAEFVILESITFSLDVLHKSTHFSISVLKSSLEESSYSNSNKKVSKRIGEIFHCRQFLFDKMMHPELVCCDTFLPDLLNRLLGDSKETALLAERNDALFVHVSYYQTGRIQSCSTAGATRSKQSTVLGVSGIVPWHLDLL